MCVINIDNLKCLLYRPVHQDSWNKASPCTSIFYDALNSIK